jgi:hypothetical protein
MRRIPKEEIIQRLTSEFGYPPEGAVLVADQLAELTPEVYAAFQEWWLDGLLSTFQIGDYTLQQLVDEHLLNPIAAFLTLNWLQTEPEQAEAALRRGHDRVL